MFPLYLKKDSFEEVYRATIRNRARLNKSIAVKDNKCLRIMTYNIQIFGFNGKRSAEMVLDVLRDVCPDIIGFQEFKWNEAFLEGAKKLGYSQICYKPVSAGLGFGNAILSKIKMSDCAFHTYGTEYREPRNWVKASFYDGKLVIFNTHLDVFDKTGRTRLAQIEELLKEAKAEIAKGKLVVVMGDLNSMRRDDYTKEEIENIEHYSARHPLDFKVAERIDESGLLYEVGFPVKFSVKTGKRVDFIYLSRKFSKGGNVYYSEASDHLPLFCDL